MDCPVNAFVVSGLVNRMSALAYSDRRLSGPRVRREAAGIEYRP
jgi:hypothetical protein